MFKKWKSKKMALLAAALIAGTISFANVNEVSAAFNKAVEVTTMKDAKITDLKNDTRVFKVDKSIETKFVTFYNRYGIEIAGHLYLPKNFDARACW